jgi:hypothetical protein
MGNAPGAKLKIVVFLRLILALYIKRCENELKLVWMLVNRLDSPTT